MTLTVTALVLAAALMHAGWNAIVKSNADRLISMSWIAAFTSVIAIPATFLVPLPGVDAIKFLAVSLAIHTAYMLLLVRAYVWDFGQVYPLARGLAPVLVTFYGVVILGETLTTSTLVAIGLIAAGIVSLSLRRGQVSANSHLSVVYALATGLAIACYTVVDGIGGRTATTPISYVVWLFAVHGIPITVITFLRRTPADLFGDHRLIVQATGGALMSVLAYGIVIWAMARTPLGPVSALRETSVVFAALISSIVLKEAGGRFVLAATSVVAAGIILLRLG
ncbi:MAG: EamA family transporter [Gammaproteobacteria bacterium]|nr:EamA family transporter [Gammaproteobacteria bacterium]